MRQLTIALLAIAAFAASVIVASAKDDAAAINITTVIDAHHLGIAMTFPALGDTIVATLHVPTTHMRGRTPGMAARRVS
jgi:hypothetical protein